MPKQSSRTDTDRLTQLAERPYGFLGMSLGGRKILGIDDLRLALDDAHEAERQEVTND